MDAGKQGNKETEWMVDGHLDWRINATSTVEDDPKPDNAASMIATGRVLRLARVMKGEQSILVNAEAAGT